MKRYKNRAKWIVSVVLVLGLLVGFFLPVNKYIETPGGASELKPFVKISGYPDNKPGSYMITYVQLAKATPFKLLAAHFDAHASIEKEQAVTGGVDDATYNKVQNFYMQNAINEAVAVAFQTARKPLTMQYVGIFITDIAPQSKFKDVLKVGDTVTKIDDKHFNSAKGYQAYLASKKIGMPVSVTYVNAGKSKTVTRKLINIGHRAGLGIVLADNVNVKTKPMVNVNPGGIGGPSGGLMFSLQIYDQLVGGNLRKGRQIAGTGTIALDGTVGEIGGIDKKIIAAKKAGATVFLAPYIPPTKENLLLDGGKTNYQVAKETAAKYAPKMKIVPVDSFQAALTYLAKN